MGYSLLISKVKCAWSGGKLYGYCNMDKLESLRWLIDNKHVKPEQYWDEGFNPQIVLYKRDYKKFIELYIKDYNKYGYTGNKLSIENFEDIEDDDSSEFILLEWL